MCARWIEGRVMKTLLAWAPLCMLVLAPVATAQSAPSLLFSLTDETVESLASEAGWSVGERIETEEEDFRRRLTLPNGLPVEIEGLACESDDLDGCPEYQLTLWLGLGSSQRAQALQERLSYRWADVGLASEEAVVVSRTEFMYGGVSREHLRATFATFEQIARDAGEKAFPCGLPVSGVEPTC
jgi:hypothetical protein